MSNREERAAMRHRRNNRTILLFAVGSLLIIIAVSSFLIGTSPTRASGPARVGLPLKNFSLTDIQGKTINLADFAGKTVLINAWATWCPPCKAEMPDLNAYYQTHLKDGFVILAINAGDPASVAASFASQTELTFPVLLDLDTSVITSLGIHSFPSSILLGTDGKVIALHVGMFTPETLEAEITPYLAKKN
jgi:cytochrome c biogenesis protein CcmG, thiol:disulfide interchange protein DsbE